MKRESVQPIMLTKEAIDLTLAVPNIADNRMTEMLEVVAYLMPPSGQRPGSHERPAPAVSDRLENCYRGHATATLLAGQGMIEVARFCHRAAHKRQVLFHNLPTLELLLHAASSVGVKRKQQYAAGAAIQSVHCMHGLTDQFIPDDVCNRQMIICVPAMN